MKKLLITLTVFVTVHSCNNNDYEDRPVELIGTWRLIEQYSDPGDGSGDYVSIDSDKTIIFLADGTITSNGNLCSMSINSDENTTGTYNFSQSTISPNDCFSTSFTLTYEIQENRLFVYYPCIEGCGQKFRKIQ